MSTTVLLELLDGLKYKSGAAISHALATISDKGEVGNLIELIEKADIDHKKQLKLVGDKKFRNGAFIGSTTVSIVMLLTGGYRSI